MRSNLGRSSSARRLAAILVVVVMASLGAASAATAATVVGQAPPTAGASFSCGPGTGLQAEIAGGNSYVVPAPGGVITRWRTSLTGTIGFSVFTGSGTTFTKIADDERTINGTLTQFDVRIPVVGGERIGMRIPGLMTPGCLFQTSDPADKIAVVGSAPIGTPTMFSLADGFRFNIAADLEPDVDLDGFGDESQDSCPTNATTQGTCPDIQDPKASIDKKPKKKATKRTARFRFSSNEPGAVFACALDGGKFRSCSSPFKKKVSPGKHSFQLQATDAAGNESRVVSYRWRVER